jgi:hypothetical protein
MHLRCLSLFALFTPAFSVAHRPLSTSAPCSRDDKRFTEKKNKTDRANRKKEDNVRIRELVDSVLANDPRIKRIRAEEKAARAAKKNGGKAPAAAVDPKVKAAEEAKKKEEEAKAAEEAKKAAESDKVRPIQSTTLMVSAFGC